MPKRFSYDLEKEYYSRAWPRKEKPYLHLESYLRCWVNPEKIFKGKRILDVGAGECTYTRLIAERFNPRQVIACELFIERMLPAAKVCASSALQFVAGDCFRLPFHRKSFDLVWGSGILSQLPNLEEAIQEFRAVLKTGGVYVGWEPNPFNIAIAYRYFFRPHSRNQYLFWPWLVSPVFERAGFSLQIRYFYAKLPSLRNRFLATCLGILAKLEY